MGPWPITMVKLHPASPFPVAVTVKFDSYRGPTLTAVFPSFHSVIFSWLIMLTTKIKLAWAVTIYKAQGLTLMINVGKKEFPAGLTFVTCSRARCLQDYLFDPS